MPTRALEPVELRAELERAERRIEVFKAVGRALGSGLDLDTLLTQIVPRITDLLDADRSSLFLVDPENEELWSKVLQGTELSEIRLPFGRGLVGWVAEHGRPISSPDVYADPRFNHEVDLQTGFRTRSALVWPLRRPAGRRLTGVVQVLNKQEGAFDHDDERLLEAVASELAMAIEAARLYEDLTRHNRELERARSELQLLFDTERAITQSPDLGSMLRGILETARETLGTRAGVLWVGSESQNSLEPAAVVGLHAARLRPGKLVQRVHASDRAVRTSSKTPLRRGRLSVRSVLAVPIHVRHGGPIGVIELLDKRGKEKTFDLSDERALQVVADQAGRAITAERRRLEREQSERLSTIGRMLSGIVHDLRTPLTLIAGYADRMELSNREREREAFAEAIRRQVDQVNRMTREVLAFARGERNIWRRRVRVEAFDREMAEYLEHEFEGTGIELEIELSATGEAWVDDGKLRRVFANIARNARQAMDEGGTFQVSSRNREDHVEWVFEDTGPGIPEELRARIFEPFATAQKDGGTGLGLAMVKQIVEDHGGAIRARSRRGNGARFELRLPRTAPADAPAGSGSKP